MGNLRRIGYGFAAAVLVALTPTPVVALAVEPSPPDPTVMDVVDRCSPTTPVRSWRHRRQPSRSLLQRTRIRNDVHRAGDTR